MALPLAAIGGALGGLGQLAGGLSGLFGGSNNNAALNASRINADQDRAFQMAAATQGIRWKVADAKAAGIHPLFALGAPTFSPSPTSLLSDSGGGSDVGRSLSMMGQGVERALMAAAPQNERDATMGGIMTELGIERARLQNDLLRAQIGSLAARVGPDQIGPPGPSVGAAGPLPGQTNAVFGKYEAKPPEVLNPQPTNAGAQAGPAQPSVRWERNPDGSVVAMPTAQMDDLSSPGWANWQYINRVLPFFSNSGELKPPKSMLPPGYSDWHYGFPGRWIPTNPRGPAYGEGVHYAPRRGRALPRVIDNPK